MRAKTKEMMSKLHKRLVNTRKSDVHEEKCTYVTMDSLKEELGLSAASIYRMIRMMKMQGLGIYSRTGKGYVLAEFASKRDDVNALRKINGRRTSDMMAVNAARQWMRSRWSTDYERRMLQEAIRPLLPDVSQLERSQTVLLRAQNSLGI